MESNLILGMSPFGLYVICSKFFRPLKSGATIFTGSLSLPNAVCNLENISFRTVIN